MDTTTTIRLHEIEKMKDILLDNNYGILYDKKDNSNNVIFKKEDDILWLRFQRDYPFDKDEFEYFTSHSHWRLTLPWKYFSLIFHTLWFKFKYVHRFPMYLFTYPQQTKFAWFNFVDIIWERQGFQAMRNDKIKSKILVIWQPQGSQSRVFVYFDRILSDEAFNVFSRDIKIKEHDDGKTISVKPLKDRVEKLGRILLLNFEYRF